MIQAVIFDADGMLVVNSYKFSVCLERDYGVPLSRTLPFFKSKFQECLVGRADLKEEVVPFLKEWGWSGSVEEFLCYWFKSEHNIDESLVEYVKKLKKRGIKVFIATNNEKYRTEYLINQMGFGEVFDRVYGSGHVGSKKPDREFFEYIIEDQNLDKEKVILWDDDPENIEGALKVGIKAELYMSFEDFKRKMERFLS